jgi:hypothetical protein
MTAGPSGTGVTKEIKVRVVEPTPTLEFFVNKLSSVESTPITPSTNASQGALTRNYEVVKSGNTYTIEKPLTDANPITMEWFTVLTNWQSALVKDTLLLSNDSLKTPSQREYYTSGGGIKESGSNAAVLAADFMVGIGTTSNLVALNINTINGISGLDTAVKYVVKKDAADANGFTSSALAHDANDATLLAAALAIPADGIITIDSSLTVAGTATAGAVKAYDLRLYNSSNATVLDLVVDVVATKYTNVVQMGGLATPTLASGTGYRFVNMEMTTTGPSNIFAGKPAVKAALNLTAGKDGIVLFEQATGAVSEATVQLFKTDKLTFDSATSSALLDGQEEDQLGFRRAPLTITNTTVAGTYTMVFKVDTLELPVTLIINNPQPKLFVLSGTGGGNTVSAPSGSPFTFSFDSKSKEPIKYFDASSGLDTVTTMNANQNGQNQDEFALLENGEYKVYLKSNQTAATSGLYGRIAVADITKGAHSFKVVKTYPDGRTETVSDRAEVTSFDENGLAVFGSPTLLNVNNTIFNANFLINEPTLVKGKFTFEFTIGSVSKTYVVNVVELPSLSVSALKVGTATARLAGGEYQLAAGATYAGNIVVDFTKNELTTADFVEINSVTNIGGNFTDPTTTLVELGSLTSLNLGTLASASRADGNKVFFTLKFWKKVPYSTSTTLYQQIGENQNLILAFKTAYASVVITAFSTAWVSSTAVNLLVDSGVAGNAYYAVLANNSPAPTAEQLVAGTGIAGLITGKAATASVNGSSATTFNITGLTANTNYDIYFVVVASSTANVSRVVKIDYRTSAFAAEVDATASSADTGTDLTITYGTKTTASNTFYYFVSADGASAISPNIVLGVTSLTELQVDKSITLTAAAAATTVIALADGAYRVLVVEVDTAGLIVAWDEDQTTMAA